MRGTDAVSALRVLLRTPADPVALLLRLFLGVVMFPHGAQKVLGWWGGYGLSGTMTYFTGPLGIPAVFAALAIAAEFLGSSVSSSGSAPASPRWASA